MPERQRFVSFYSSLFHGIPLFVCFFYPHFTSFDAPPLSCYPDGSMKAIPAIYENGIVTLLEPVHVKGPTEALVVLADAESKTELDPWEEILRDPTPRPALSREADEVLAELHAGKTKLLDPDDL